MDVLVIGGSVFLGRAMVSESLAAGHSVTVFNRGRSGSQPDGVEQLVGDRTLAQDVIQLDGRHFDLVIDTCGYVPAVVGLTVEALAPTAEHYSFVSSINAFPGWPATADYLADGEYDGDPDAAEAPDDLPEGGSYGWLKVGCERAVARAFGPGRSSLLRAGLIVGPDDSFSGRLPWWLDRVARGGEVLVPGSPDATVSFIDSRDLAQFTLLRAGGVFETPGPPHRDTRANMMEACRQATGSDATFTYVDDDWLATKEVQAWTEVPLWIPAAEGPSVYAHHPEPAIAAGLSWRPLAETIADTWAWQQGLADGWQPSERTPGLSAERERKLIEAWHTR